MSDANDEDTASARFKEAIEKAGDEMRTIVWGSGFRDFDGIMRRHLEPLFGELIDQRCPTLMKYGRTCDVGD